MDDKLKKLHKKVTSNKTKHVEAEKKLINLTNKVTQISDKGYDFSLGWMYFIGNNGYQNFLIFAPMIISLILYTNKKVTNWISSRISSEKIKPFDINIDLTMSNLANLDNSILVQKSCSAFYSNFILNLRQSINEIAGHIVLTIIFVNCLFDTVKLVRIAIKSKFTNTCPGFAFDENTIWWRRFMEFW